MEFPKNPKATGSDSVLAEYDRRLFYLNVCTQVGSFVNALYLSRICSLGTRKAKRFWGSSLEDFLSLSLSADCAEMTEFLLKR